ncbi:MAG: hypothetical protein KGL52_13460 [Rhodospirillales bacterium]|nr:hypothetical protein [Rhodospirillales bacterium]
MNQPELAPGPDLPNISAGPPLLLAVHLFGTVRAADAAGRSVLPRARKTRALLAVLALLAPRAVPRTRLIALLWSQRETEQARASLRQARHELQLALGHGAASLLRGDRHELALSDRGLWSDVAALRTVEPGQPVPFHLYRPPLLADLVGVDPALDRWIAAEAARLERIAEAQARAIISSLAAPAERAIAAQHLLARDPTDRAARDALTAALEQGGDPAGAARRPRAGSARAPEAGRPSIVPGTPQGRVPIAPARTPPGDIGALAGCRPRIRADGATVPAVRIGAFGLRVLPGTIATTPWASILASGLSEELVAALTRFRGVSCVPLAFESRWPDAEYDFLLDGLIQASGETVRVSLRLQDCRAGGEVIWATRFDRQLGNLLTMQDELAAETVAQLESRLLLLAERHAGARPDPEAQYLLRQALPGLLRLDRREFERAGRLLDASRRLDPRNPAVHVWLAHWHLFAVGQGWADDADRAGGRVRELAGIAVGLDPEDARGLALAAHVRGFVDRHPVAAVPLHARASDVNPNLPLAWSLSGLNESYLGRHDEAIRRAGLARRLSPHDPLRYFFDMALAAPLFLRGDAAEAVRVGNQAIAANPGFSSAFKIQLAALGELGRHAEAAEIRARLLALEPGFSLGQALDRSPIEDPAARARYADGLRRGGLR